MKRRTKAGNKKLDQSVRNWLVGDASTAEFRMPSGAGTLTGNDIVSMLDKGVDSMSDYDPDELINVATEAFENRNA